MKGFTDHSLRKIQKGGPRGRTKDLTALIMREAYVLLVNNNFFNSFRSIVRKSLGIFYSVGNSVDINVNYFQLDRIIYAE